MTEEGTRSDIARVEVRRRKPWTKAARTVFLDQLFATCNVTRACRAAGKSLAGLYRLRGREPAFAAAWDAALEEGYCRLEAELLRCALGNSADADDADVGDNGDDWRTVERGPEAGLPIEPVTPFDPELAFKLLTQRQARDAKGQRRRVYMRQPTRLEVLTELDRRLTAMERRVGRASESAA